MGTFACFFIAGIVACRIQARERVRRLATDALDRSGVSLKQLCLDFEMDHGQLSRVLSNGTLQFADVLAAPRSVSIPILLAACEELGIVTADALFDLFKTAALRFASDRQLALPLDGRRVA